MCVTKLDVPALTQPRSSSFQRPLLTTPKSTWRQMQRKPPAKMQVKHSWEEISPSMCEASRERVYTDVGRKTCVLFLFIWRNFTWPIFPSQLGLKISCCTAAERARKQERVCLLEEDAKNTWLKWWHAENDRKSDRYTNEETKALQ